MSHCILVGEGRHSLSAATTDMTRGGVCGAEHRPAGLAQPSIHRAVVRQTDWKEPS